MEQIVIVGSGASGVHFAINLLEKGHRVTMVDVGRTGEPSVAPEATLNQLKENLSDPSAYFLGRDFTGVTLPSNRSEYYGIPPNKLYVFEKTPGFSVKSLGFSPLFSFGRGGLAEAWTGGAYPLRDQELAEFPFGEPELLPYYAEVAKRIGVTGKRDDLATFMPMHGHLLPPLCLDDHSAQLLTRYERRREIMHRLGCYMGRTRVATLSRPQGSRRACDYKGRCLWGCPSESLYTPSLTLRECQRHSQFQYLSGLEVQWFRVRNGRAISLIVRDVQKDTEHELAINGWLALAAGTLSSARIFLTSMLHETGNVVRLSGLMDNRQVLVPFVNLGMLGQRFSANSYQYHLLGIAIISSNMANYVHGQITTLKTALLHPVIQKLPFDTRTAIEIMRAAHSGLGIVNLNFSDTRRTENYLTLDISEPNLPPKLVIRYAPDGDQQSQIKRAKRTLKRILWELGCFVPPGMTHVRPMGASVHYSGVLPMTTRSQTLTTNSHGCSNDFGNVYLVDGSTFPFLPAKNLTFTLMANATRIAREAF